MTGQTSSTPHASEIGLPERPVASGSLDPKAFQIEKLLSFLGYGNPAGRFWFVGMEEQGEGTELELEWRCRFRPVEDVIWVHEQWDREFRSRDQGRDPGLFEPRRLIPTWGTMSKLVLRLSGSSAWEDLEAVRRYQAERLGRLDGDTFLTELLPLPARNLDDWPYTAYFYSRADYVSRVLPERLGTLRALFESTSLNLSSATGKPTGPTTRSCSNQLFSNPRLKAAWRSRSSAPQASCSRHSSRGSSCRTP